MNKEKIQVTFVVGATASGKSDWALQQAEKNKGVILNCDSVQAYAHVQIGAAKPSQEDYRRVPHYLYGYVDYPHESTAGEHRRAVLETLEQLKSQGPQNVYIVGGTGFYFQALEKGMFQIPKEIPLAVKENLAERLRQFGLLALYKELQLVDEDAAAKIHPNDEYRILRALEIFQGTGTKPSLLARDKKLSSSAEEFPYPLQKVGIAWDREELHRRIHQRVKLMLKEGLIEEVEDLRRRGWGDWSPLRSVGYKEVQLYLQGEIKTKTELEERILISTRQLAKRQITWFRRDIEIQWITK